MKYVQKWACFLAACVCAVMVGVFSSTKAPAAYQPFAALIALVLAITMMILAVVTSPLERRRGSAIEMGVCVFLAFIVTAIIYPVFQGAHAAAKPTVCLSNIKQLSLGLVMYAGDADDHFPVAQSWRTAVSPYLRSNTASFRCPVASSPWTYGMNTSLSGIEASKIEKQSECVLLYEADSQIENAHGGAESFVRRHDEEGSLGLADGTARRSKGGTQPRIRWRP